MRNFISAGILALFLFSASHLAAANGEHPKFFQELNLTDAQKQQIKAIRKSGVDKKEKRQEIMAVLTPEQKAQLKELRKEWKASKEAGGTTPNTVNTSTTSPSPAPTVKGTVTPLPGVPVSQ
jgi:Spy/CpxP family protein refolding chaperone